MTACGSILVEMPPHFDPAGDTGSIGRFSSVPGSTNSSVQMDIKGDTSLLVLHFGHAYASLQLSRHSSFWGRVANRVVSQSGSLLAAGTIYNAVAACCSSSFMLVKVANTGEASASYRTAFCIEADYYQQTTSSTALIMAACDIISMSPLIVL